MAVLWREIADGAVGPLSRSVLGEHPQCQTKYLDSLSERERRWRLKVTTASPTLVAAVVLGS
jgi:hypothetical protein